MHEFFGDILKTLITLFIVVLIVLASPSVIDPAISTVTEPVESLGEVTITAYCSCPICCGSWASNRQGVVVGAHGIPLEEGVSVASPLPAGTVIDIEGIGVRVVHDKTATWIVEKYDGKIVDLYFTDHEEASRFGRLTRNVTVVSRGK